MPFNFGSVKKAEQCCSTQTQIKKDQWECMGVLSAPSFPTVNNRLPDSALESSISNTTQPSSLFWRGLRTHPSVCSQNWEYFTGAILADDWSCPQAPKQAWLHGAAASLCKATPNCLLLCKVWAKSTAHLEQSTQQHSWKTWAAARTFSYQNQMSALVTASWQIPCYYTSVFLFLLRFFLHLCRKQLHCCRHWDLQQQTH